MKTIALFACALFVACASTEEPDSAPTSTPVASEPAPTPAKPAPTPSKDAGSSQDDDRDPKDCTGIPDRTLCDNNWGQCVNGVCEKLDSCYGESPQEFLHCNGGTASERDTSTALYTKSRVATYACAAGELASEVAFEMNEDTTQTVTVTLSTPDLDLIILEGDCSGIAKCAASGTTSVTFTAQANTTYYIVVDGKVATPTSFHIAVACQ